MILLKKIVWDFSDTDFEDCLYEEALNMVCLPESIETDDLDEESLGAVEVESGMF